MNYSTNKELKIGSVVRLRSGGPMMTMTFIYEDTDELLLTINQPNNQFVQAMWFDKDSHLQADIFDIKTLTE